MRLLILALAVASLPTDLNAQEPDSGLTEQVTQAIIRQTNEFRASHELASVSEDKQLQAAAVDFAKFMARTGKYGHRADGRSPAQRATAAGYQYCVVRENIAYRLNTGEVTADGLIEAFVQGWIDSPPHRENMLADYVTQTGVAVATSDKETYYAVQLFGRPQSAAIQIQVRNESAEIKTLITEAQDNLDEFELPPHSTLKMKRCFPTTLRLANSDSEISLTQSAVVVIQQNGLQRASE